MEADLTTEAAGAAAGHGGRARHGLLADAADLRRRRRRARAAHKGLKIVPSSLNFSTFQGPDSSSGAE